MRGLRELGFVERNWRFLLLQLVERLASTLSFQCVEVLQAVDHDEREEHATAAEKTRISRTRTDRRLDERVLSKCFAK